MPHHPIFELLEVMGRLRSPSGGCPWDLEQNHRTLRHYAIEEVYELLDAIEAGDDHEMAEELGDLLLQVVFHCQLAHERGAFDFTRVCQLIVEKLIRRHPHVFAKGKLHTAQAVLAQWDQIKHAEKKGTRHERPSVFDGIPRRLPALMRAQEIIKKARKAGLSVAAALSRARVKSKSALAQQLYELVNVAQQRGWPAESLLRDEAKRRERGLRREERRRARQSTEKPRP